MRRTSPFSPMRFPADPILDPSISSLSSIGGNDAMQADYPQHVSLSPKMAALWKNLMTQGAAEPQEQLRVPTDTTRGNSLSATPPATGRTTQLHGIQPSGRDEGGPGASVASDTHLNSDRGRPQDAITEAKHLISDLASIVIYRCIFESPRLTLRHSLSICRRPPLPCPRHSWTKD